MGMVVFIESANPMDDCREENPDTMGEEMGESTGTMGDSEDVCEVGIVVRGNIELTARVVVPAMGSTLVENKD